MSDLKGSLRQKDKAFREFERSFGNIKEIELIIDHFRRLLKKEEGPTVT